MSPDLPITCEGLACQTNQVPRVIQHRGTMELKCKMLGTELAMHTVARRLYARRPLPILALAGKGRQTNLPHGNFNEFQNR